MSACLRFFFFNHKRIYVTVHRLWIGLDFKEVQQELDHLQLSMSVTTMENNRAVNVALSEFCCFMQIGFQS